MSKSLQSNNKTQSTTNTETRSADGVRVTPPPRIVKTK